VEILTKIRFGGGHFEIWLPAVAFFTFNAKNIFLQENTEECGTTREDLQPKYYLFPYYYDISDNLFKYANCLIKYARYKNVPNRKGFYTKNTPGSVW